MRDLMAELKRRRVFRVAGVYGAAAFVVWQVADIAVPALQLPSWLVTAVVALTILGFPIAFVLAWAFDITPEGVTRTESVPAQGERVEGRRPGRGLATAFRLVVAGVVIILAGGVAALLALREGSELETGRVVVDVFANRTGDPQMDVVGMMAADVLVEALQGTGTLQVIPLNAAVDAARALEVGGRSSRLERASALAAEFQARVIVSGSYYLESDSLRFVAEVTDARRRQLLYTTSAFAASRSTPSHALAGLRDQVLRFLSMWGGEAHLGHEMIAANLASQPSLAAYREWAIGDDFFTRGEFREAQPHFARAAALDSMFTRALGRAILSHTNVGEYEEAEPYVRRLLSLRERMTPYERVATDWVVALHARDVQRQYQTSRQLASMVPVPLWLYVSGSNAVRVNRPAEAVAELARIDPAGGYASRWRSLWTAYGDGYHQLGDFRRELRVIRLGRGHHPDYPQYIEQELVALSALGRTNEVMRRLDELLAAQDPVRAVHAVAAELDAHGHPETARVAAERALSWVESRPTRATDPQTHRSLAAVLALLGRNEEARALLESVVASRPDDLDARGELGAVAARLGDGAAASEAFAWLDAADPRQARGRHRYLQAGIAAELGENARAVSLLREAFAQGQPYGVEVHRNPHFRRLRGDAAFREILRPKG